METVYAYRDIAVGEELCLAYIVIMAPTIVRQKGLEFRYKFSCTCDACAEPSVDRTASDNMREQARKLNSLIGSVSATNPRTGLVLALQYLQLFKGLTQGFPANIGEAAYCAFELALVTRDLACAKTCIKEAYQCFLRSEGPLSERTLKAARDAQNPRSHPCWK
eukprot:GEMP01022971.1.p1 GENE.GEMP01022971.1~~GEMP01022971.1.p1  ORF type:complete len:164 (+),score=41.09 GEMP01022971.1:1016-1507(+)